MTDRLRKRAGSAGNDELRHRIGMDGVAPEVRSLYVTPPLLSRADDTDLRHGYSLADRGKLAVIAVLRDFWHQSVDINERRDLARPAIAEYLYGTDQTPSRRDLIQAAQKAIDQHGHSYRGTHGASSQNFYPGMPNFWEFWREQARHTPPWPETAAVVLESPALSPQAPSGPGGGHGHRVVPRLAERTQIGGLQCSCGGRGCLALGSARASPGKSRTTRRLPEPPVLRPHAGQRREPALAEPAGRQPESSAPEVRRAFQGRCPDSLPVLVRLPGLSAVARDRRRRRPPVEDSQLAWPEVTVADKRWRRSGNDG